MRKPQTSYLQTRLRTASPEELTIITFDVLINATTKAVAGLRAPILDVAVVHRDLRQAQRAAALLMGSLRMEVDSNLGGKLFSLYEYWHHELFMANMRKSPDVIEQLLPQMKSMRESWQEANRRYRASNAAALSAHGGAYAAG